MLRLVIFIIFIFASGRAHAAESIPGLGPIGEIKKVHSGFKFTEGPVSDKHGNLFFTDIPANKIYKLDSAGALSVFHEPSNNADGLAFNPKGELLACELQGQVVAYSADGKQKRVIAAEYNGKRFNAPNDLTVDKAGGIYFTDPRFLAPRKLPQSVEAVYYVDQKGTITRIIDDLKGPNGIILSPDGKTLYVIPSLQAEIIAYTVKSPGEISKGRIFGRLKQSEGKKNSGGDGKTTDEKGNLYVATKLGLQVFSPAGKLLGIIEFPEQTTNATFGGKNGKTLFVAARTSIYSAQMKVKGYK